jgi:hypothetical protein
MQIFDFLRQLADICVPEAQVFEQQYLTDALPMMLLQAFAAF